MLSVPVPASAINRTLFGKRSTSTLISFVTSTTAPWSSHRVAIVVASQSQSS